MKHFNDFWLWIKDVFMIGDDREYDRADLLTCVLFCILIGETIVGIYAIIWYYNQ